MNTENLKVPTEKVDMVLDTDAFNEIDDQFAISYALKSKEKLNVKAIYAAPFFNRKSENPKDGMEKSYNEILKILSLTGESCEVFKGSYTYLPDEKTPVISPAAQDLARRAENYSPERPLYVVAIAAITNIASAILINPKIVDNIVVVWLGGHAFHYHDTKEFNMEQDIAAARVVMGSGVAFVQLPCMGVVSNFTVTEGDLKLWFLNKGKLADYLAKNTIQEAETYAKGKPWSRVIWDVTAVAWLLNDNEKFMRQRVTQIRLPSYDNLYEPTPTENLMTYVYFINRDELFFDMVKKLTRND